MPQQALAQPVNDSARVSCDFRPLTAAQRAAQTDAQAQRIPALLGPLEGEMRPIPLNGVYISDSAIERKVMVQQIFADVFHRPGLMPSVFALCAGSMGVTAYLNSRIDPNTHYFLIRDPGSNELIEPRIHSFRTAVSWGMALGATLVMGDKGILSVESRFLNQNGIDATLEIRF